MRHDLLLGVIALLNNVLARSSMIGLENGIYYLNHDADGNINITTRLDFTYQPDPQNNHHLARKESLSQDEDRDRLHAALWPWKHEGSSSVSVATKVPRTLPSRSMPTPAAPELQMKQYNCTDISLDLSDTTNAQRQMMAYCDQVSTVDAYQHLASKWNTVIVYICARGHPEQCSPGDVQDTMDFLDRNCTEQEQSGSKESSWVFNNYLHPQSPANKYGRVVQGANFC
ncbi:hypothetical protein BJ166DRAFT_496094 [Pestalotiopsis sp. NC0098]|nr:hypothetical protein BJ166DRAFT_496094 [Pestalotiopsis sp. NC0098]